MRIHVCLMLSLFVSLTACDSNSSGGDPVCEPQVKKCDGNDVIRCKADGTDWELWKECGGDESCHDGGCFTKVQPSDVVGDSQIDAGLDCAGDVGTETSIGDAATDVSADTSDGIMPFDSDVVQHDAYHPSCAGKECGGDGCGGSCGSCNASKETCIDGVCVCLPESQEGKHTVSEAGANKPSANKPKDDDVSKQPIICLNIEVEDLQAFHPYSLKRQMMSLDGAKLAPSKKNDMFGIGLLVEAENRTDLLLEKPSLSGRVDYHLSTGRQVSCSLGLDNIRGSINHLSFCPNDKKEWQNETNDQLERIWRPDEKIRMFVRNDCAHNFILDVGVEKLTIEFAVSARGAVDGEIVRSAKSEIEIPGSVLVLQAFEVDDTKGFVSGNIAVVSHKGKITHISCAEAGLRVDLLRLVPLPEDIPTAMWDISGIGFLLRDVKISHWTEAGLEKGTRLLTATLQLSNENPVTVGVERNLVRVKELELAETEERLKESLITLEAIQAAPTSPESRTALGALVAH